MVVGGKAPRSLLTRGMMQRGREIEDCDVGFVVGVDGTRACSLKLSWIALAMVYLQDDEKEGRGSKWAEIGCSGVFR